MNMSWEEKIAQSDWLTPLSWATHVKSFHISIVIFRSEILLPHGICRDADLILRIHKNLIFG